MINVSATLCGDFNIKSKVNVDATIVLLYLYKISQMKSSLIMNCAILLSLYLSDQMNTDTEERQIRNLFRKIATLRKICSRYNFNSIFKKLGVGNSTARSETSDYGQ